MISRTRSSPARVRARELPSASLRHAGRRALAHRPYTTALLLLALGLVTIPGRAEDSAHEPSATSGSESPVATTLPAATTDQPAETGGLSERESQGLVNLGGSLTERGDYAAAEIAFRQVLNGDAPLPQTKRALLGLAHMHRKQGSLTKAAAIYERYLKDFPADDRVPDALLELGRTLRDMGTPRLAIARFYNVINSTLKLPADSGFGHYQLLAKTAQFEIAETYFQSGDYAEANKFFSRLRMLDLAPTDRARAHFKAAFALQLDGDFAGAVTSLRAFIDQWPDDENIPEARFLLATSLRRLNRPQEALTATLDLLRAERSRSQADAKRWAYWQRRTGNQLANEFFQNGDFHNALSIYSSLAALGTDLTWRLPVTYQVALCYERLGDLERACATYRAIVADAGEQPAPDLADVVRMAQSRLAHVDWRDAINRRVATLFDSTTGQDIPTPEKPVANDTHRSSASAPAAL